MLLFLTGNLTIAGIRQLGAFVQYPLRYPNLEVRASLTGALLEQLIAGSLTVGEGTTRLYELLLVIDFAG